jgi:hypothetical protein
MSGDPNLDVFDFGPPPPRTPTPESQTVTFTLESDNPYNTTLRDHFNKPAYILSTDFTKHPVSRLHDAAGMRLAEWVWRDVRGDKLSLGDTPPRNINARSWLKGSVHTRCEQQTCSQHTC